MPKQTQAMKMTSDIIRREAGKSGVLPFARFMELALYAPDCGYYEKETGNVGRRGDFYTSVSVGSLFGKLLAFQFAEWLCELTLNSQLFFGNQRLTRRKYASYSAPKVRRKVGSSYNTTNR